MRSIVLLPALAVMCYVQAQQIDGYRYWYDDDVAAAVTTAVSNTPELVLVDGWPTSGLGPGHHRVSVQIRDTDGNWSVPQTHLFTRSGSPITGYRYWTNDDVSTSMTGSIVPNTVVHLNTLVDPGTLPNDFNTVTIQFRDADGEWTVPHTTWSVKGTGAVDGYQYWIDDDIANATTSSIGPAAVVDLIAGLPIMTTTGTHTFTIRFSGANGTWSVPLTTEFSFITDVEELPGITDLLLFPNPVTDQLGLRLTTNEARTLSLQVLDLSGSVVADLSTWSVSATAHRSWDISTLASGSYMLRITGEHGAWTTRFVKP
ncbi:MAG: T9SS type A sorting domain-containing protein [Flavobacteriales bacterium]|nr:T9SS type A sorting domain-containing protein [Flavobacteriales bacterium]